MNVFMADAHIRKKYHLNSLAMRKCYNIKRKLTRENQQAHNTQLYEPLLGLTTYLTQTETMTEPDGLQCNGLGQA
jgi:hypothetical protein